MKKFFVYILMISLFFSNLLSVLLPQAAYAATDLKSSAPQEKIFKSSHTLGNATNPLVGGDGKPNGKVLIWLDKFIKGKNDSALATRVKLDERETMAYCLNYDLPSPSADGNKYFKTDERLTDLEFTALQYGHAGEQDLFKNRTDLTTDQKYYITQIALYIVSNDKGPKNKASTVKDLKLENIAPYIEKGGFSYFESGLKKDEVNKIYKEVATFVNKITRDTLKTPQLPKKYELTFEGDKSVKVKDEVSETGLMKLVSNHTTDTIKLTKMNEESKLVDENNKEVSLEAIAKGKSFKIQYQNTDLTKDVTETLKVEGAVKYQNVHKYEPYADQRAAEMSQSKGKSIPQRMAWISYDEESATSNLTISFKEVIQDPSLETTAMFNDGSKQSNATSLVTIVDKVDYTNLIVGKDYTIKGKLMDKATEKPLLVNGKEVVAEKTFTTEAANGSIHLEFTFNASALKGKEVVVFEDLFHEGIKVGTHSDINDKGQTVQFTDPKLHTTATFENGNKESTPISLVTIIDKVDYENLIEGKEYVVKGKLMDKATEKSLLVNGKEVVAEKTFTAETANGSINLEFTFNASALKGKEVVVFEDLYQGEDKIGTHSDINDLGQTVKITEPRLKTTATFENGNKESTPISLVTIIDKVDYENLIEGKEYVVKGKLMDKATEKPLLVNGKEVVAEKTFTAETVNGSINLEFTFNASALKGKEVVVFEDLYQGEDKIGTHSDINDLGQTVKITEPRLKTTATFESGKKSSKALSKIKIVDKVDFENLVVGQTYTIKGKLMDKATEKPLLVNGKEVVAEKTFTAETTNGSIHLEFAFDTSTLEGKEVVVFEDLYQGEDKIGTHSDINDKGQTVKFFKPVLPQMNTATKTLPIAIGLMMIAGAFYFLRNRKEQSKE